MTRDWENSNILHMYETHERQATGDRAEPIIDEAPTDLDPKAASTVHPFGTVESLHGHNYRPCLSKAKDSWTHAAELGKSRRSTKNSRSNPKPKSLCEEQVTE